MYGHERQSGCHFISYINKKFILREEPSELSEMTSVFNKVFASGVGVVGKIPAIAPAMKLAGENHVLAGLFAYGLTASMALETWSFDKLLNRSFRKLSPEEVAITKKPRGAFLKTIRWIGITSLTLLSEAPGSYVSYYYNGKKNTWFFIHLFTHLAFPMVSLDRLISKISRTNLCSSSLGHHSLEIQKGKHDFVQAIEKLKRKLLTMTSGEREEKLHSLYSGNFFSEDRDFAKLFVQEILEISEEAADEEAKGIRVARYLGVGMGITAAALSQILHGYLMYELTDEFISKNPYVQSAAVATALIPKSFLLFTNVTKVFSSASEKVAKLFLRNRAVFVEAPQVCGFAKRGLQVLAGTASAFSVASLVKTVADRFDFSTVLGKVVMGACVTTAFSNRMMSMLDFIDQFQGFLTEKRGTPNQIEIRDLQKRLDNLKDLMLDSSNEEFEKLMACQNLTTFRHYGSV